MRLCEKDGNSVRYVSRVKGDGGVDWEWTGDYRLAANVSPWWTRRFLSEGRYLGRRRWTGETQYQCETCSVYAR